MCRDRGSNTGPSDLQSDALPTELSQLLFVVEEKKVEEQGIDPCASCMLSMRSTI